MANPKEKSGKKQILTREPHKRTAGIFDNVRKLPHPVEEYTGLVTPDLPSTPEIETNPDSGSKIDRPKIDRPKIGRPKITGPKIDRSKTTRSKIDPLTEQSKGFLALPHAFVDQLLPQLTTTEQVLLLRLFRLSRGFNSETCEVGQSTLQIACNVTRNTLKTAIQSLIDKGHIERLGTGIGHERSIYKINILGVSKIDRPKIDRPDFGRPEIDESGSEIDRGGGSKIDPIINNSSIYTQHTQQSARAGSRFSLEDCRKYADHLASTGQGITNPRGFATTIFRTGDADSEMEAFFSTPARVDITKCPDCSGSGFLYLDPTDMDKGVKPCRHERLSQLNVD